MQFQLLWLGFTNLAVREYHELPGSYIYTRIYLRIPPKMLSTMDFVMGRVFRAAFAHHTREGKHKNLYNSRYQLVCRNQRYSATQQPHWIYHGVNDCVKLAAEASSKYICPYVHTRMYVWASICMWRCLHLVCVEFWRPRLGYRTYKCMFARKYVCKYVYIHTYTNAFEYFLCCFLLLNYIELK